MARNIKPKLSVKLEDVASQLTAALITAEVKAGIRFDRNEVDNLDSGIKILRSCETDLMKSIAFLLFSTSEAFKKIPLDATQTFNELKEQSKNSLSELKGFVKPPLTSSANEAATKLSAATMLAFTAAVLEKIAAGEIKIHGRGGAAKSGAE